MSEEQKNDTKVLRIISLLFVGAYIVYMYAHFLFF